MNNKQKYKILINTSILGCFLFFLLTGLAMYFYPGGSMYNNPLNPNYSPSSPNSYSLTLNFFSDLGLHNSWSGKPNIISNILFSYSLFFVSISIITFYSAFHFILKKDKSLILISKVGIFISFISAVGFILVGFTPSDQIHNIHMFSVNLAFRSFLIVMLIYCYAIFRSNFIKNYISLVYIILFALVAYYVYIIIAGPILPKAPYGTEGFYVPNKEDLLFHVISQKFVVYGLIIGILWQLVELKKEKYTTLIN